MREFGDVVLRLLITCGVALLMGGWAWGIIRWWQRALPGMVQDVAASLAEAGAQERAVRQRPALFNSVHEVELTLGPSPVIVSGRHVGKGRYELRVRILGGWPLPTVHLAAHDPSFGIAAAMGAAHQVALQGLTPPAFIATRSLVREADQLLGHDEVRAHAQALSDLGWNVSFEPGGCAVYRYAGHRTPIQALESGRLARELLGLAQVLSAWSPQHPRA
jgi:hypothetical protein